MRKDIDTSAIYRAEILEHYRNPQNFGTLKKADLKAVKINELCGDEIVLEIALDSKKRVKEVRFSGAGCALSIASASLFTESIKSKTLAGLSQIKPDRVLNALGVPIGPARKKCVLLPYDALQKILKSISSLKARRD